MSRRFVGVRLPTVLVDKAKDVADGENRTLSNYILNLIDEDIRRREAAGELGPRTDEGKEPPPARKRKGK